MRAAAPSPMSGTPSTAPATSPPVLRRPVPPSRISRPAPASSASPRYSRTPSTAHRPIHTIVAASVTCSRNRGPRRSLQIIICSSSRFTVGSVTARRRPEVPGVAPPSRHATRPTYAWSVRAALPETRYARAGGAHIAYQVLGHGPVDIVLADQWFSDMDGQWDVPPIAEFRRRLSSFSRLIMFDKRGIGLSDPVPIDRLPTIEEWIDDLRAVMDAVP